MKHPKTLLRVVAAGVLALTTTYVATAQDDDASLRAYYSANGLLNRGLYDLAAEEYRAFLDDHPNHEKAMVARYGLGVALFRQQKHEEAAVELAILVKRDDAPYPAEVATVLGQSYLALGHYDEAAAAFGVVLDEYGTHDLADDAAALQAESLHRAGRHADVERPVRILVSRNPDSPLRERAELFAGLSDIALGRHPAAAQRFKAMLERQPDGKHAEQVRLLLAQSLHRSGNEKGAEPVYRDVLDRGVAAYQPEALYGLAALLQKRGEPAEAGTLLDRFQKNYATHALTPAVLLLRGRAYFDLEAYDDAARCFSALTERDGPERDDAGYWLAKCDLRRGKPDAAAERLAGLEQAFPDSPLADEVAYDRAVALVRAEKLATAAPALEQFRARWPQHALAPDATHLEATVLHQLGQYDDSLARCRTFTGQWPHHALARPVAFLEAENLYLLGQDEAAANAYAAFLRTYPEAPEADEATFRSGLVLHRLDRTDEAEAALERVVDGTTTEPQYHAALLALGDLRFRAERWDEAVALLDAYLAGPDGGASDLPGADDALMKSALARHRLENYEGALAAYDALIMTYPDSPHRLQAMFERGQALVALERADEAQAAFVAVLDEGDSRFTSHALNHLGAIALEDGRFDEAAGRYAALSDRADAGSLAIDAMYQQGQAEFSQRNYTAAAATLGAFLSIAPNHPETPRASAERAIALARGGEPEAALVAIADVESHHLHGLDPELRSAVLYDKAWCLRNSGDDEAAMAAYRALLAEPDPTTLTPNATLELADLERAAGDLDEAETLLTTLVADDSSALHEAALYRLGAVAYEKQDHQAASEHLSRFVAAHPDSALVPSASLLAGESFYKRGAFEKALPHLERAVTKTTPDDAPAIHGPALLRLGECRAALQQWRASGEAFNTYLREHPDSDLWFQARFGIGWSLENQARYDDAIQSYREVVDRHQGKTAARAQFQIGECLFAQKSFDEAVRALLKVDILYAYPEWSAAALHEAGRCFVELRDPTAARQHFQQVIDEHADTEWATLARRELERLDRAGVPGDDR